MANGGDLGPLNSLLNPSFGKTIHFPLLSRSARNVPGARSAARVCVLQLGRIISSA